MDRASNQESTPDNVDPAPEGEPSAAQFREAARQAAARVRASMAERTDEPADPDPGDSAPTREAIEEAARTQSRALADRTVADGPTDATRKGKKAIARALREAHQLATDMLPRIDERLVSGARMLRAFETQVERLERSAAGAEEMRSLQQATPDLADLEDTANALEKRLAGVVGNAERVAGDLEEARSESASTSEAIADGLETANTVRTMLESTIRELTEETERRSLAIGKLIEESEEVLARMTQQVDRAAAIERSITQRLQQAEDVARDMERSLAGTMVEIDENTDRIERTARTSIVSIRRHIAMELSAIGAAMLQQCGEEPPPSGTATRVQPTESPEGRAGSKEAPLIEIESIEPPMVRDPEGISHGTLAVDGEAIKRRIDAG